LLRSACPELRRFTRSVARRHSDHGVQQTVERRTSCDHDPACAKLIAEPCRVGVEACDARNRHRAVRRKNSGKDSLRRYRRKASTDQRASHAVAVAESLAVLRLRTVLAVPDQRLGALSSRSLRPFESGVNMAWVPTTKKKNRRRLGAQKRRLVKATDAWMTAMREASGDAFSSHAQRLAFLHEHQRNTRKTWSRPQPCMFPAMCAAIDPALPRYPEVGSAGLRRGGRSRRDTSRRGRRDRFLPRRDRRSVNISGVLFGARGGVRGHRADQGRGYQPRMDASVLPDGVLGDPGAQPNT
jgi:hypothetical protein